MWKNAHIKDLNALRILINSLCIYLGGGKEGCTNACMHVYVWEHIVIAFTTEPLNGCLRNLVGMKCSWPSTCIYRFFRPYPPRGGSRGGPFLKKTFFRLQGYSNQLDFSTILTFMALYDRAFKRGITPNFFRDFQIYLELLSTSLDQNSSFKMWIYWNK